MPKAILVSGASSGIGRALSLELDRLGYLVFAGVRNSDDAKEIRSQASPSLTPVLLDVTIPETISSVCQLVSNNTGGELFCLVNNAGISVGGAMEFIPIPDFRHQFEVNLIGQLALTQSCLSMLRKGKGRILFISSATGRLVTPFNGPYAASKAALVAIADALRLELAPWKVMVTVFIVGSVQTAIWDKSSRLAGEILRREPAEARQLYYQLQKQAGKFYSSAGRNGMRLERLVKTLLRQIKTRSPKEYVLVGSDAVMIELITKLYPVHWRDWLMRYKMGLLKLKDIE